MLKNFLIMILAILFALGAFEFFLKHSPYEYGVTPVEYDAEIGTWHRKKYENYAIRECYKTKYIFNKEGLVSNIFNHDSNKKDVILLGDSYVEAIMVENTNIIHNALAREFKKKYNFLNYGLSDSSPIQQLIILKQKVNLENTKYVLQFIGLEDDLEGAVYEKSKSLRRPKVYIDFKNFDEYKIIEPRNKTVIDNIGDVLSEYQLYFFLKRSFSYFKKHVLNNEKNLVKKRDLEEEKKDLSKNWLHLKGAIYQTKKHLKSIDKNIGYKIVIFNEHEINNTENNVIIKKFLEKENIEYVFLEEAAKNLNMELSSFTCDRHWDDDAHNNIAKIIKKMDLIK